MLYCIAGKFGRELNFGGLAILFQTTKFISTKMFAISRRLWNIVNKPPNLADIITQRLGGQIAKFLTANISGYTVF